MSNSRKTDKKIKTPSLDTHKFETSNYVKMKSGTRRDNDSGRLISSNPNKEVTT